MLVENFYYASDFLQIIKQLMDPFIDNLILLLVEPARGSP